MSLPFIGTEFTSENAYLKDKQKKTKQKPSCFFSLSLETKKYMIISGRYSSGTNWLGIQACVVWESLSEYI